MSPPNEPLNNASDDTDSENPQEASLDSSDPVPTDPVPSDQEPTDQDSGDQDSGDPEGMPEYEPLTPELVQDEAARGDFMLRWAVVLLAFLMGCTFIAESPTLVHVKTGEYLATHGIWPPANDVFSYTVSDRPWINLSWLFDLVLAGVYAVGGAIGLTLFKALLAAVTFWFVVNLGLGKTSTWGVSICAAVALLACHNSLTAQPMLITLLGLASMFWVISSWKSGASPRRIYALIPLFFLWANFDPRMFLGLTALVLYGLGDFMGVLWGRPSLTDAQRKPFQLAVAGSLFAVLLNPFGWHTYLRPLELYGKEYPAFREFLSGSTPNASTVRFYTLLDEGVWNNLGHSGIAAVALGIAAILVMYLNFRRLEVGHVLIFFAFAAFAVASVEQLPAAALVFAILLAINGQSWYQANFSQSYSVKPGELIFSRGGRAVTVLAFAALAFMAGTGWLRPPGGGTTGLGFDESFKQSLNSLAEQCKETYSDRVFNANARQGDMLIWSGQKPFTDMRLRLYLGEGDQDLLTLHKRTGNSLRIQHLAVSPEQAKTLDVTPTDWKPIFDKYEITHAMPRLTMAPFPDYPMLRAFMFSTRDWQLTSLSGSAAVVHRVDPQDPELMNFIKDHGYDFVSRAFREDTDTVESRSAWPALPNVYEQKVWKTKLHIPEQIQLARHLNVILQDVSAIAAQMPLADQAVYPAIAWLAVRQALQGLDVDPSSADGYVELGNAYRFLASWNQGNILGVQQWHGQGMRFFQALMAYNMALAADPTNATAHSRLFEFYNSPGFARVDLALRELEALDKILSEKPTKTEAETQQLKQIDELRTQMTQHIQQLETALKQATDAKADPLRLAKIAAQNFRCPAAALQQLEKAPEFVASHPEAKMYFLTLLLEVGRIEDAYETAIELEYQLNSSPNQIPGWRSLVAAAYLANAEYDKANELWTAESQQIDSNGFRGVLGSLPPRLIPQAQVPWPMSLLSSSYQYLFTQMPQLDAYNLNKAFALLESGQCEAAGEQFQEALDESPDMSSRQLVAFYLAQITRQFIDPVRPINRVPVIFADEKAPKAPEAADK